MIIIGNFIELCFLSVLIGIIFGFAMTYLLKKCRSVSHSAVHETFLIFCNTMLTYFISDLLKQSGITSLVACAIIEAQYAWYNLSP